MYLTVMSLLGEEEKMPPQESGIFHILKHFSVFYKVGVILFIWGARCAVEAVTDGSSSILLEKFTGYSAVTLTLATACVVLAATFLCMRLLRADVEVCIFACNSFLFFFKVFKQI